MNYRCSFAGTHNELKEHLESCKYESMKDFIKRTEAKITDLQLNIQQKDQEIGFLRSMLGTLSERLEAMEKSFDMKLGKDHHGAVSQVTTEWKLICLVLPLETS